MSTMDESLVFGISIIDRDHRKLFGLIDAVKEACSADECDRNTILFVIRELKEYANTHFKREEALMLAADYDLEAFNPHRIEHEYFESMVKAVGVLYENDRELINIHKLMDILTDWLTNHIGIVDRAYVKSVNNFGKKFRA